MITKRRVLPANFFGQEWGGVEGPHEVMFAPARTILAFLRYPLGYAIVNPLDMLRLVAFMIIVPPLAWGLYAALIAGTGRHVPADTGHIYLVGFALVSWALNGILWVARWRGLRRGEAIHTRETGYTWLTYHTSLPVPLCEMFIVPVIVGLIGLGIDATFSINLGRWLMFSACSLFGLSFWESRRRWSQMRSAIDEEKRLREYERGFKPREEKMSRDVAENDVAILGAGLGAARTHAPRGELLHQQGGDIGTSSGGRDPAPQNVDDTLF